MDTLKRYNGHRDGAEAPAVLRKVVAGSAYVDEAPADGKYGDPSLIVVTCDDAHGYDELYIEAHRYSAAMTPAAIVAEIEARGTIMDSGWKGC